MPIFYSSNTETIEYNLKSVNEIYLSTVARGIHQFTSTQRASLQDLASQCPALGGEGVFRARSLYYMINKNAVYNDELTCLNQGILFKKRPVNNLESSYKIFPNPTTGEITFFYYLSENDKGTLSVIDNLGQTIITLTLTSDKNVIQFNLGDRKPGLYFLKMFSEYGSEYQDRIIIIR